MDAVLAKLRAASLRPLLKGFFREFGYHCAAHQIRVILISCVVITSLLYPALALYVSSRPLSTLSTSLLDIFPTDSQSPHLRDLHDVWSGHEALHLRYDATSKARCGLERTVRVERLLIANNRRHENGVLNKATLELTLDLEAEIATRLASSTSALPCIRTQTGNCLFTSPLSFWEFNPSKLTDDSDILGTLNRSNNITLSGFPITLPMVVAGRASLEVMDQVDIGTFLVLTYFFRDDDCHSTSGHAAWIQLVNGIMEGRGQVEVVTAQPRLLAIQFDADHSNISLISILLYMTYLMVFIHFSGSMRRMNTVHSRFGIAFTGIVEIIVSTITSVSVCAIWGFRVTMVPWGILPIVIVFVGAENMFRLVDDVVSTSITLPVKERIATGLSEAGASNTLKVVTCNAVLGIIAVIAPGAIRQFCIFAVVVLVAHWFLVHTFFVAVLSIDMQRLELNDLLRQGRSFRSDGKEFIKSSGPSSPLESRSPKEAVGIIAQVLQGRAARNGSLIMVLTITAVLYSITYSAVPGSNARTPYTLDKVVALRKAGVQSPAWQLWQTLNPSDDPLVHMRVEAPSFLFFDSGSATEDVRTFYDMRIIARVLRGSRQLITIFILPIATTTTLLWFLLIYLLKGSDSRDDTQENAHVRKESQAALQPNFQFSTIPRACGNEIERIDATPDGSTIIATSLENEVAIWSQRSRSFFQVPISDVDKRGSVVTAVAMDTAGVFCAVGTQSGVIALWRLERGKMVEKRILRHPQPQESRIIDLVLEDRPAQRGDKLSMLHRRSLSGDTRNTDGFMLVTFKDGSVVEWSDLYDPKPSVVAEAANPPKRPIILRPNNQDALAFATISSDGEVQFFSRDNHEWHGQSPFIAGSQHDPVIKLHAKTITVELSARTIIVTATKYGQVALWDGVSGERWYTLEDSIEDINRLRLAPVPSRPCPTCAELLPDTFTLTISSGTVATIHRFSVEDARRCSCLVLQPPSVSNILRSRQGSFNGLAPPPIRSRLPSLSASATNITGLADFPVSAHGVHSRRGSERDAPRRPDSFYIVEDVNGAGTESLSNTLPILNHSRLVDVSFQEGAWDTLDHLIYGLRRSSELETVDEDAHDEGGRASESWESQFEGLEVPVLERWKLWVFDPRSPDLGIKETSLAALIPKSTGPTQQQQQQHSTTLHNRNIKNTVPPYSTPQQSVHTAKDYLEPSAFPRLSFTEVSSLLSLDRGSCLVAFGNTVGLVSFTPDDPSCVTRTFHSRATSSVSTVNAPILKKKRI